VSVRLPENLIVIERGWLSANNILGLDGDGATLIDSGYISHAGQTVDLIRHALNGRPLKRLMNTHSHSDHIGGNAALKAAFDCEITVPAGLHAAIADWNDNALLLSPLGQRAALFRHDRLMGADNHFEMAGLAWQSLAVPGHDMEALAFYCPEARLLISGDALWENGFGVLFPELLGTADGLNCARQTLEMLGRLSIDVVIPGHGSPFGAVDAALERAFRRLESFETDIERLAWHAIKVITAFAMMEKRRLPVAEFPAFLLGLPFAVDVNARYLDLTDDQLVERIERDLLKAGALRREADWLVAG
jgi:glyoxylase-like metal-dependent hydrolase (beta-lactamase superfamily II)